MRSNFHHTPVLLEEVLEALQVQKGAKYIDATLGGGGHGVEIVKRGGVLLGMDQDSDAIEFVTRKWKVENGKWKIPEKNLSLIHGNFGEIERIARENGFEKVAGILFDLGFSSYQIEKSGRGFSFLREEPLDMRMSYDEGLTAADIVNTYSKNQLQEVFERYGEERESGRIAALIVESRGKRKIQTSKELADLVSSNLPRGMIHPATRVFQALRIAVNDELNALRKGLEGAINVLDENGKIAVISFHSLEDRIVKNYFKTWEREGRGRAGKKPIIATDAEVEKNPRARSAKLRVFVKKS